MTDLRKMKAAEFARRLKTDSDMPDKPFAFFLGAGCSISSGIPGTASLVRDHWLPRLQALSAPDRKDFDAWVKEEFPDYDPNNTGLLYGPLMEKLFVNPEDRQQEIERLCAGKFPGFGYTVLAKLIASQDRKLNVVITTNFDDLVSDAVYLSTKARPLVIGHESLAGFIRPTRTRPLVVKLHGDAHLAPRNTSAETKKLQKEVERQVSSLLNDRGLIVMGYGGNDQSIASMLKALPLGALPLGIYWVSSAEPQGILRPWLEERNAIWVEQLDFDETMLLLDDAFKLSPLDQKPFDSFFQNYAETYKKLSDRIKAAPAKAEDETLKGALKRADKDLSGWLSVAVEAEKFKKTDPKKAEKIYEDGLERFPTSAPLLGNYAVFLKNIRKDYDQAGQVYLRALEADPNDASNLGSYTLFLHQICKDYEKAEQFYLRALEADPNHATNLGNYAVFLETIRKDYEKAEQFYLRALEADSNEANTLGNYAVFLKNIRKDYEKAEQFYLRALEADPNHANTLGNYALFLENIRKDYKKAEQFYLRALEADPNDAYTLGSYAVFLETIRKDYEKAEQFYLRALEADSNEANTLGNYALFLKDIRKDYEKAEQFYLRALEADPNHTNTLGNYAVFLENIRKDYEKAKQFYLRALEADSNNSNILGNYAGLLLFLGKKEAGYPLLDKAIGFLPAPEAPGLAAELWFYAFCHWPENKREAALKSLKIVLLEGERSPDWDFSQNIERARQDGHADIQWLELLADVITKGEDIKKLEAWPAWQNA